MSYWEGFFVFWRVELPELLFELANKADVDLVEVLQLLVRNEEDNCLSASSDIDFLSSSDVQALEVSLQVICGGLERNTKANKQPKPRAKLFLYLKVGEFLCNHGFELIRLLAISLDDLLSRCHAVAPQKQPTCQPHNAMYLFIIKFAPCYL